MQLLLKESSSSQNDFNLLEHWKENHCHRHKNQFDQNKCYDEIKKFHTGRNLRCSVLQRTAFQAIFACVLPYILLNFFCCVFDPAKFYFHYTCDVIRIFEQSLGFLTFEEINCVFLPCQITSIRIWASSQMVLTWNEIEILPITRKLILDFQSSVFVLKEIIYFLFSGTSVTKFVLRET